jgi:XTP/dITP diphosphohydrolase
VIEPRRWVLASGNAGKLAELRALLQETGLGGQIVAQSELGIVGPPENGSTFVENALTKARHASRAARCAAIADDSGLVVDALGGAPGVLSARYAGEDAGDRGNVAKLLAALRDTPEQKRGARFYCVLVALERADDPAPIIATGEWAGEIARAPVGIGGFGYDPVFYDPALAKTAAELTPDIKNRVSHRGRALRMLVEALRARRAGSGPRVRD